LRTNVSKGSAIKAMAKNRDNDTARTPFFLVANKQEPLRKVNCTPSSRQYKK